MVTPTQVRKTTKETIIAKIDKQLLNGVREFWRTNFQIDERDSGGVNYIDEILLEYRVAGWIITTKCGQRRSEFQDIQVFSIPEDNCF